MVHERMNRYDKQFSTLFNWRHYRHFYFILLVAKFASDKQYVAQNIYRFKSVYFAGHIFLKSDSCNDVKQYGLPNDSFVPDHR